MTDDVSLTVGQAFSRWSLIRRVISSHLDWGHELGPEMDTFNIWQYPWFSSWFFPCLSVLNFLSRSDEILFWRSVLAGVIDPCLFVRAVLRVCCCRWYGMVWYGMVYVDLYSAIVAKFSNALCTLVPRKQPSFQGLFEGVIVLLCEEVVGRCRMGW